MTEKRVLVTGSARGIGRATALRLAEEGWKVAVHFVHSRHDAESLVEELGAAAGGAYQCDLNELSQVRTLIDRVVADGALDALVNNAGVYLTMDFVKSSDQAFEASIEHCMRVNYVAPAWLTRAACKHFLVRGHGKVVNVASRVGHRGEPGAAGYSASKAALINMTRALSVEHAKSNIQHFGIAPGWVDTAMAREGMNDRLPEILAGIPLGRMASPGDCAATIAFLLREEASYLSGVVIDINGASYLH